MLNHDIGGGVIAEIGGTFIGPTQGPVEKPCEHPNAALWDGQTLETWLRQNSSGSEEFLAVATGATEAIFGAELRDLSLLYVLFYIAASGNEQNVGTFERNFNTAGGAPVRRISQVRGQVRAYTDTILAPGTLYDFGEALRPPFGRRAATDTSTYWNGYMDGAIRSGERVAAEVLAEL